MDKAASSFIRGCLASLDIIDKWTSILIRGYDIIARATYASTRLWWHHWWMDEVFWWIFLVCIRWLLLRAISERVFFFFKHIVTFGDLESNRQNVRNTQNKDYSNESFYHKLFGHKISSAESTVIAGRECGAGLFIFYRNDKFNYHKLLWPAPPSPTSSTFIQLLNHYTTHSTTCVLA